MRIDESIVFALSFADEYGVYRVLVEDRSGRALEQLLGFTEAIAIRDPVYGVLRTENGVNYVIRQCDSTPSSASRRKPA